MMCLMLGVHTFSSFIIFLNSDSVTLQIFNDSVFIFTFNDSVFIFTLIFSLVQSKWPAYPF